MIVELVALMVPLSFCPELLVPEKLSDTEVEVIVPLAVPVSVRPVLSLALNDPLATWLELSVPLRFTVRPLKTMVTFVVAGGAIQLLHAGRGCTVDRFVLETDELANCGLFVVIDPEIDVELLVSFAVVDVFWLLMTMLPDQFPEMLGT